MLQLKKMIADFKAVYTEHLQGLECTVKAADGHLDHAEHGYVSTASCIKINIWHRAGALQVLRCPVHICVGACLCWYVFVVAELVRPTVYGNLVKLDVVHPSL